MSTLRYNPWTIHRHLHEEINTEMVALTTKGERSTDAPEQSNGYSRVERSHGTFYLRVALVGQCRYQWYCRQPAPRRLEVGISTTPETKPRRIKGATH